MTNEQRASLENLVFSASDRDLPPAMRLELFLDLIAEIERIARQDATADAVRSYMEIAAEMERRI